MKAKLLLFSLLGASLAWGQTASPPSNSPSSQPVTRAAVSSAGSGSILPVKSPGSPSRAAWVEEAEHLRGAEVVSPDGSMDNFTRSGHDLVIHGPFRGNVSLFQGNLYIVGAVTGTVSVVGGTATIIGSVDGPVRVAGGDLRLSGIVRGGASVVGGRVIRDGDSRILGMTSAVSGPNVSFAPFHILGGPYAHFPFGFWKGQPSMDLRPFLLSPLKALADAVFLVLWLVVAVAIAAAWPTHIASAAEGLRSQGVRYGAAGLLFWIAFWFLAICAALLSLFAIGIPFAMLLFALYVVVKWYGYTIVFAGIGRRILRPEPGRERSVISCTATGAAAAGLFRFIPVAGLIGWQVLGWVAAGVVVVKVSEALARRSTPMLPVQPGPLPPPIT